MYTMRVTVNDGFERTVDIKSEHLQSMYTYNETYSSKMGGMQTNEPIHSNKELSRELQHLITVAENALLDLASFVNCHIPSKED